MKKTYKNKNIRYNKTKKYKGGTNVSYITLKKGTLLYRAASDICDWNNQVKKNKTCSNTGKCGVYLSTYPLQSIGMLIEYNINMPLGVFQLISDVKLVYDKYANLNSNLSHFSWNDSIGFESIGLGILDGEVFLSGDDINLIKLIDVYDIKLDKLNDLLYRYNFNGNAPYLEHFKKINCNGTTNKLIYEIPNYSFNEIMEIYTKMLPFKVERQNISLQNIIYGS